MKILILNIKNGGEMMADNSNAQYIKMTETPVTKLIITLGIPTTISMLVTNIYNMADTYFVSTLGTSASGAVGIVFGFMAVIQAFGFMFGHGAGSIISRCLGKKDMDEASDIASTSFFAALIAGIIVTIFGLIFIEPLAILLGSTKTILPYAKTYIFYILLAAPVMTGSFVLNNILRYEGKAALAMIGLISGAVINIFGDFVLIKIFNMGIAGAGISTAVSQTISFCILLSLFLIGKTQSKLRIKNLFVGFKNLLIRMKNICVTGLSSFVRQGLTSFATMVLNNKAGAYDDATVAAISIVSRISFFIFAVGLGIGQGYQPVAGFNYGAGKYSRVKKGFFSTLIIGEVLLGTFAVIGMFFTEELVRLFRNDPDVIEIGSFALKFYFGALFFQPLAVCATMMLQSVGKSISAAVLSSMRSGLLFLPTIYIMSAAFGKKGIVLSQPLTDVLAFLVTIPFVVVFFKNLPKEDRKEEKSCKV